MKMYNARKHVQVHAFNTFLYMITYTSMNGIINFDHQSRDIRHMSLVFQLFKFVALTGLVFNFVIDQNILNGSSEQYEQKKKKGVGSATWDEKRHI